MMLTYTDSNLRWHGRFLCYRYADCDKLKRRDEILCERIVAEGFEPTHGEGRTVFYELQRLSQRIFYMTNIPPPSPTKPITLIWQPPTSERLADIINTAHPELPPVNDYEARANLAIINESLEAHAEETGRSVRIIRATPVLVMHLLGIAGQPITPDSVSEMLQKVYAMYGDQPVGFESEDEL